MTSEERKIDYLSEDAPVNGQTYCCLSFVEPPQDQMALKESYMMNKFLNQYTQILYLQFCRKHDLKPDPDFTWDNSELYDRYADFKSIKYDELCAEYSKGVGDVNHTRMLKVRGSYRSIDEARKRASDLQRSDVNFSVFVAPVGMWGPFNPVNINDIDPEYMEETMQKLVKTHLDQEKQKTQVFEERKRDMMNRVKEDNSQPDAMKIIESSDETSILRRKAVSNDLTPATKEKLRQRLQDRKDSEARNADGGVSLAFGDMHDVNKITAEQNDDAPENAVEEVVDDDNDKDANVDVVVV